MTENEADGPASRIAKLLREAPHRLHAVSEFCHVGYFATAAGLAHEFHSLFAGLCGALLVAVLVLNFGGGEA